jgi:hypothetical protein
MDGHGKLHARLPCYAGTGWWLADMQQFILDLFLSFVIGMAA